MRTATPCTSGPAFGAVIAREDVIVAEGFNHVHAHNHSMALAEIVAIRKTCAVLGSPFLEGCTI